MHISKPCDEKYAAMSPNAAGRHCEACITPVVDFTGMTETEITAYFKKHVGQTICGRYKAEQVSSDGFSNRVLHALKRGIHHHIRITPFRLALLSLMSALFTLSGCIMGKRADPEAIRKYDGTSDSAQVRAPVDSIPR